eukprot:9873758-Alexandrium_andersonii.AAC.1
MHAHRIVCTPFARASMLAFVHRTRGGIQRALQGPPRSGALRASLWTPLGHRCKGTREALS